MGKGSLYFFMKIKEAELKQVNTKALQSMDKSIRLVIDINLHDRNKVDVNALNNLMHKPLIMDLTESK